ncbi:class I SAM-dependent methyltransferase [Parasphingopyxis marina]|uniref:Class I SAM-dependent methyltransferase n=1 Tax=Parasphingopyxis marina TaxID=2761622 RepID=A0A842I0K9_9SPHN|nr:class I SAM-dependent methyltransferase [Parasphingopyxis marina]MBC2778752.1 class I SAM-dependent methyltransferase [Parasphingopyxis marina]
MCNTTTLAPPAPSAEGLSPRQQEFSERLLGMLNDAAASMMISIGHRTGLFTVMQDGRAVTSAELAEKAKLHERYVREWLGAMTTARIVSFDPASGKFTLPADHGAFLGEGAEIANMAGTFQFISILGGVESKIVDCFENGGGVPYEEYERFHECMAEESDVTVVAGLEDHILPMAPGLIAKLEAGIDVADIGCGSGHALIYLGALYPNSRFTGFDLCEEAVVTAIAEAKERGLSNVDFVKQDATLLEGSGLFDAIFTFDAVHDQAQPATVLAHIRRLLKDDGVYLMQDIDAQTPVEANIDHPMGTFVYTISCMHCMTVSLAQGGVGLGAAWGEQLAEAMLKDAGFRSVSVQRLPHDEMNLYFVCRP